MQKSDSCFEIPELLFHTLIQKIVIPIITLTTKWIAMLKTMQKSAYKLTKLFDIAKGKTKTYYT